MKKSFNIQKLLHCKSKHHETKANVPLLKRDQECNLKQPSSVALISINKTKQNKRTTFLHR